MAGRGVDMEQLAEMTGFSLSTLYGRFAGSGAKRAFFAGEVAVIARALAVPIESIYSGKLDLSRAERSVNNRNLTFPPAVA